MATSAPSNAAPSVLGKGAASEIYGTAHHVTWPLVASRPSARYASWQVTETPWIWKCSR